MFSSDVFDLGSVRYQMTTVRYSVGWRAPDQDKKPAPRVARILSQDYKEIKAHCLAEGGVWEDPDFPAISKSVYYSVHRDFEWKRPTEIADEPHMFVGGATRFDVQQGDLGNCWFLAAVASLCATRNKGLIEKIVPTDNSFTRDYAGVFHFNIWQYGKWIDVVVDDRLPTVGGRLVFMHSADKNEFWSALLEKAYAKLNGSYEALSGGCSSEAMEDFTGGVCEIFNFKKNVPKDMTAILKQAQRRKSLMGCTIDADSGQIESVLSNGLVMGHAYSVTGFSQVHVRGKEYNLLRIRNPWGNQYEWKGAWGDSSSEWQSVSQEEKDKLGLKKDDDGEFWMELNDFMSNYHKLEICFLTPGLLDELSIETKKDWNSSIQDGSWRRRVNAGGCRNFLDTFWTNPQYKIQVVDVDEDDQENLGTVIIALLQKERRKKRQEGLDLLTIGYMIYPIQDPSCGPLDMNYFKYNQAKARSPTFSNMREVCGRHRLEPGHYVVIPCTFRPHEEGDFLMRIFSERAVASGEIDEETRLEEDEDDGGDIPHHLPGHKRHEKIEAHAQDLGRKMSSSTSISLETKSERQRRRRRMKAVTQDDVDQEHKIRKLFRDTAGADMEVDAFELRKILNEEFMREFTFDGFSLETCRSMVAMKDTDRSGKLGYDEFKRLWTSLRKWKKIFKEFDKDKSSTFNSYELREALGAAGICVSNSTFNSLVMRYSDQQGRIYFDDFILCAIRLRTMFDIFTESKAGEKDARFSLDQFIQTTMYS